MKHTVIESDRIIVNISKSDDNTITIKAFPACQLKLNRAVVKFVDYASTFSDDDDDEYDLGNEESKMLDRNVERMTSFIYNCDVTNVEYSVSSPYAGFAETYSLNKLATKLSKNKNVLASFSFKDDNPESIEKLFNTLVDFYGITYMGFIMCDIITLVKKACEYEDLWENDSLYVPTTENVHYDISSNV